MITPRRHGRKWLLAFVGCLGLISYFAYHAVHGERGLKARTEIEKRLELMREEHARLKAERERLEALAKTLTAGEGRDEDLIEEQARAVLNFARPTNVILIVPKAAAE
jgi:cell division protein FtsB